MSADVSWQTALANSAVSAAEDVRSAVRAAKTASNAKTAAASAAMLAQKACDTGKFRSIEEARGAQTRASIAQSHAIHAAVVEHEAKTVKRRATLALAHDVKCWNAHRKREIIRTALAYAKSQHEATRRAVDAWSCLRDGYVGSTIVPSAHARRAPPSRPTIGFFDHDDVKASIFPNGDDSDDDSPSIVPVDHDLLKQESGSTTRGSIDDDGPETILPFVVACPIPEEDSDAGSSRMLNAFGLDSSQLSRSSMPTAQPVGVEAKHENETNPNQVSGPFAKSGNQFAGGSITSFGDPSENEALTSSMQSLVNGLMNWGGQYDSEEDFALPTGMAASIAMQESGVFSTHHKIA